MSGLAIEATGAAAAAAGAVVNMARRTNDPLVQDWIGCR